MAMQAEQTQQAPNIFERTARANANRTEPEPPAPQNIPPPAQPAPVSQADSATLASMLFGDERQPATQAVAANQQAQNQQQTANANGTMPAEIVAFMRENNWGQQHLKWHSERRWDAVSQQTAQANGWQRAAIQEGEKGNGMEFLAMHRGMMEMLRERFPQHAALFASGNSPPLQGEGPMRPDMQRAFDALQNIDQHAGEFQDEDDLGMFIQSGSAPRHSAEVGSPGIHNYIHNRLSDSDSPINMGDPTVNIENPLFWQLHGWIDNRWEAFRRATGKSADDPEYVQAMRNGMAAMDHGDATQQHQH